MDKEYILANLSSLRDKEIVIALLDGVISIDDILYSRRVSPERLEIISSWYFHARDEHKLLLKEFQHIVARYESLQNLSLRLDAEHPSDLRRLEEEILNVKKDYYALKQQYRNSIYLEYHEHLLDEFLLFDFLPGFVFSNSIGNESASSLRSRKERIRETEANEEKPEVLPLPIGREKQPSNNRPGVSMGKTVGLGSSIFGSLLSRFFKFKQVKTESSKSENQSKGNKVYSAVYAPASAELNKWFKVQVHLYGMSDADRVNQRAVEMDKNAQLMEKKPFSLIIKLGTQVDANIKIYGKGVQVSTKTRSLSWDGEMTSAVFQVKAVDPDLQSVAGDISLHADGILLGVFSFNTDIVASPLKNVRFVLSEGRSATKAFISYAHSDGDSAKIVRNMLRNFGYDCFYDRESLVSGEFFDKRIKESIENSDVFVLLWSKNAARSEYVEKEYLYALPLAYPPEPERAKLDFKPFFVDNPHTNPPAKLEKIHFSELYAPTNSVNK